MIEYVFLGAFISVLAWMTVKWMEPLIADMREAIQSALALS
jgi:hypothetical protein